MPLLLHFPLKRLLGRFIPATLPPGGSFHGQTVLITGATAGMGLESAVHFVRLGANVVITGRNASRGEKARAVIEAKASVGTPAEGKQSKGKVVGVLELEMNSYASCVAFVQNLKDWCRENGVAPGPDIVVLNAGGSNPNFSLSPEGWEQNIQVNALSTTLLGLLFVAWLREEKRSGARQTPAHLLVVTSRDHLYPDITHWLDFAAEHERGILGHLSDLKNWPLFWDEPNYANSKTLVMHALEEISKLATSGPNGEVVDVVVNSVCPGLVRTDIARHFEEYAWYMRIFMPTYMFLGGKTAEMGARFYVLAAMKGEEDHGKFIMAWLSNEGYSNLAETKANMTGPHARKVHTLVWQEMRDDMLAKVPELAERLPELKQSD